MSNIVPAAGFVSVFILFSMPGSGQKMSVKEAIPVSAGCFSTHNFGSGPKFMKVCFSNHGNIGRFEAPAGTTFLVGREGYVACAKDSAGTTYSAYDTGDNEGNWGAPVISQPNGANKFPLTITRKTVNNWLELKQSFEIDPNRYDVTITMTLKNTSGKTLSNVRLDRYGDWDIFPGTTDDYVFISNLSVFSWTLGGNASSISLSSASIEQPESMFDTYANWIGGNFRACATGNQQPVPQGPADFVGRNSRGFGTMPSGTSKTIKFIYRRF